MVTHAKTRWCTFGAAALAVTLFTSSAFAGESEAERLFREGRALMLEGRFDEACPMLEQSQKLDAHVGTLLNLAACHERQGRVGSAWVEYQKALTSARAEGQAERAQLAEQRIKVLEPRVPWLRISSAVDGAAVITLDGGELARVALGTEMPVDPGVHVVVAQREGATIFEERIELRESEHRSVRVAASEPAPAAHAGPDPARLVVEQPAPTTTAPPPPKKGRWIFEPGVFVAYLKGSATHPRLTNQDEITVTSTQNPALQPESCGRCTVGETDGRGSAAVGVQVFGGYALSDQLDAGIRIVAAPSIKDAGVWGFGPELVLHPTQSISLGVWGLFGDATFRGKSDVTVPPGYRVSPSSGTAEGTLAGGLGLGVELSIRLFDLGGGAVVANTTPFFLGGNGNAFCLPVGLAYHFQ